MIDKAINVVKKIQDKGFEAYFVGGCVRDSLMEIEPKDYDICTSATPEQINNIFNKTKNVGNNFLVSIVKEQGEWFEVATFRKEKYNDISKPKVSITNIEEDSKRRDFTINAIYYNPINNEYKDFHGGIDDIKNRKLKFIGNQKSRLLEDPIRILRALRFSKDFEMVETIDDFGFLNMCPKDRIKNEVIKIIENYNDSSWLTGLFDVFSSIYPLFEYTKVTEQDKEHHPEGSVFNHIGFMLDELYKQEYDYLDVFAIMLHDLGKVMTTEKQESGKITSYNHDKVGLAICHNFCNDFKFSKQERETLEFIVGNHMRMRFIDDMRESKRNEILEHKDYLRLKKLNDIDNIKITIEQLKVAYNSKI